jgi:hypothetical protein
MPVPGVVSGVVFLGLLLLLGLVMGVSSRSTVSPPSVVPFFGLAALLGFVPRLDPAFSPALGAVLLLRLLSVDSSLEPVLLLRLLLVDSSLELFLVLRLLLVDFLVVGLSSSSSSSFCGLVAGLVR